MFWISVDLPVPVLPIRYMCPPSVLAFDAEMLADIAVVRDGKWRDWVFAGG